MGENCGEFCPLIQMRQRNALLASAATVAGGDLGELVDSQLPEYAVAVQAQASCANPFLMFKRENRTTPGIRGWLGGRSDRFIMQLVCQSTDQRLSHLTDVQRYAERDVTDRFPKAEQDQILAEMAQMQSDLEAGRTDEDPPQPQPKPEPTWTDPDAAPSDW